MDVPQRLRQQPAAGAARRQTQQVARHQRRAQQPAAIACIKLVLTIGGQTFPNTSHEELIAGTVCTSGERALSIVGNRVFKQ